MKQCLYAAACSLVVMMMFSGAAFGAPTATEANPASKAKAMPGARRLNPARSLINSLPVALVAISATPNAAMLVSTYTLR